MLGRLLWTARKRLISAFLLAHLAAVGVWNLPGGPIKERFSPWFGYYLLPTGQWQSWGMFAPDPALETVILEGVARDRHGLLHSYAFTSLSDLGVFEAMPLYRHAKFASTVGIEDQVAIREYAARSVVRGLDLPEDAFPVDVQLVYQVLPTPPPGTPAEEVALLPTPSVLETYRFPTRAEADP